VTNDFALSLLKVLKFVSFDIIIAFVRFVTILVAISSVLLLPKRIMDRKQRQGLKSKTKSQQSLAKS